MLYLYTGTPGSSKTLNAVKFLSETEQFKGRPVYCYNIKECQLTFEQDDQQIPWNELTQEQAERWYDLPDGCVVFIDECQKIFRPRQRSAAIPKKVEELETHRHKGIDLVFCTQQPTLVDSAVLAQVERHVHIERMYQKEEANHFTWQKCVSSPNNKSDRARAVVTKVKFDKSYYGKYKSAVFHSPKVSVPLKIQLIKAFIVIIPLVFVGYFVKTLYDSRTAQEKPVQSSGVIHSNNSLNHAMNQVKQSPALDKAREEKLDWYDSNVPRVEGLAWTAPKYDDIQEPVSAPTPNACIHWKSRDICTCSTFQATKINVPRHVCMRIVNGGFFNPAIARDEDDGRVRSIATREPVRQHQSRATVSKPYIANRFISHTPKQRQKAARPRSYSQGAATRDLAFN